MLLKVYWAQLIIWLNGSEKNVGKSFLRTIKASVKAVILSFLEARLHTPRCSDENYGIATSLLTHIKIPTLQKQIDLSLSLSYGDPLRWTQHMKIANAVFSQKTIVRCNGLQDSSIMTEEMDHIKTKLENDFLMRMLLYVKIKTMYWKIFPWFFAAKCNRYSLYFFFFGAVVNLSVAKMDRASLQFLNRVQFQYYVVAILRWAKCFERCLVLASHLQF